jgi:hypothetical protein
MAQRLKKGDINVLNIITESDRLSNLSQNVKGSLLTFGFNKTKIEKAFNLGLFSEGIRNMLFTICDNKLLLSHEHPSLTLFFDLVGKVNEGLTSSIRGVRVCTYSGEHLANSKVFLPTVTQSVSNNELDYYYRVGSWDQETVQPAFRTVELPEDSFSFLCTSSFDLDILRKKKDIISVMESEIRTSSGRVYNIFRVD